MRRLLTGLFAAALVLSLPSLAIAAAAGSAKGVNPDADALREGATQTLVVGSDIFIGDTVQTGPKGQVQILFADNTKLVVGPKSALKIEDYLIRNDGSAGKLAVDMLSGAFRFSTGDSAKTRYKIDTPTGTIGVRGTHFDVWVGLLKLEPVTRILHYEGIVTFCNLSGECQQLTDLCTLGEITSEAKVLGNTNDTKGDERQALKSEFIYSENQAPLLRPFWFKNALDCLRKKPQVPDPENHGFTNGPTGVPPPPPPPDPVIVID